MKAYIKHTDISDWLEKLKLSKKLIVVEGKKDKAALEKLGIENIMILNKPLYEMAEEIASKTSECILLTDLDKEGKMLFLKLKKSLAGLGVKTDDSFRNFLFKKTGVRQIEGLDSYVSNLESG
jgi:5S rRNA maturation endonuclease (ribonuclease M5)